MAENETEPCVHRPGFLGVSLLTMANLDVAVTVAVAVAAAMILVFSWREIKKAIEAFNDNLPRGGPPAPMHPSPAGDDSLLRPNSRKPAK